MDTELRRFTVGLLIPHDGLNAAAFTAYRDGFRPKPKGFLASLLNTRSDDALPNQNLVYSLQHTAELTPCQHGFHVRFSSGSVERHFSWPWTAIKQVIVSNLKFQRYLAEDPARVAIRPRNHFPFDPGLVPNVVSARSLPYGVLVPYGLKCGFDVWENGPDQQALFGRLLTDDEETHDVNNAAVETETFHDNCVLSDTYGERICAATQHGAICESWTVRSEVGAALTQQFLFAIERNTVSSTVETCVTGPRDSLDYLDACLDSVLSARRASTGGEVKDAVATAAVNAILSKVFDGLPLNAIMLPFKYAAAYRKEARRRLAKSLSERQIVKTRRDLRSGQVELRIVRAPRRPVSP